MKKLNLIYFFIALFGLPPAFGQSIEEQTFKLIEGHWEGAFIKNNAYQKFDIQFYKRDSTIYSLQIIEEWHPQFGEFEIPVSIDSTGIIKINTGHGKAVLTLDSKNLEIIGYIDKSQPVMNVHFKKVPPPPAPNYVVNEVTIDNGDVSLKGHLHLPNPTKTKTAIILVGGRSCYAGSTKYDLYAKALRKYGVSVLVFNKRGTGKSTGNCEVATIGDLAADVVACKKYLENHARGFDKIGVMGSSAGGWVIVKAEEMTDFDFMISVVGPSTSVREQQFQSMEYGADFYKLSEVAKANVKTYTEMMFDAPATQAQFDKFQKLLAKAETEGWKDLLDNTDIPPDAVGIANLWVRRHNYDPQSSLSQFDNPFLAIYGGIDWIVPYKENVERLEALINGERASNLKTVVAYNAEHGTEKKGAYISLPNNKSYWHFFRISPQVLIEIIDFLKEHEFIE